MRTTLIGLCLVFACSFDGAPTSENTIDAATLPDSTPSTVDAAEPDATTEPVCAPVPAGIVAWWEGEALGVDRIASFPSSSQQSDPAVVSGLVGDAIEYGSDDFLEFDPAPTPPSFSVEGWVFPTTEQADYRTIYGAYFVSGVFLRTVGLSSTMLTNRTTAVMLLPAARSYRTTLGRTLQQPGTAL